MGRPEKRLNEPQWRTEEFPLWRLARYLRWIRGTARLSYQELADRTHLPKATLQRAADGKTLPSPDTVEAYARACGRDPVMALRWRQRAADARSRKRRSVPQSKHSACPGPGPARHQAPVVQPAQAATFDGLVKALQSLRRSAGSPTLKELAAKDSRYGDRLRPSTVSDLLRRTTCRPSRDVVLAFARACGESDEELRKWEEAWSLAWRASVGGPVGELSHGTDVQNRRAKSPGRRGSHKGRRNRLHVAHTAEVTDAPIRSRPAQRAAARQRPQRPGHGVAVSARATRQA
jgi:transcriptional regulator with XRE-family HTH domain